MSKIKIAKWDELEPLQPDYALAANVDLVVIRLPEGEQASVLYGRCLHRGALLANGHVDDDNLICGLHNWDYCFRTGVSSYNPEARLTKFSSWVEDGHVWVDENEIRAWAQDDPLPYDRNAYQGLYADLHGGAEEPHYEYIQHLAEHGLSKTSHHGRVSAMGGAP